MERKEDFTHFNDQGRAKMVDVGEKDRTSRTAVAAARVLVNDETFSLIQSGGMSTTFRRTRAASTCTTVRSFPAS